LWEFGIGPLLAGPPILVDTYAEQFARLDLASGDTGYSGTLAGPPILVDTYAEQFARLDLASGDTGYSGTEETRLSLTVNGTSQAEVGAMAGFGIGRAGAARLAAFHETFGEGSAAHGLWVGESGREFMNMRRCPIRVSYEPTPASALRPGPKHAMSR
jgi:hypothetical protein